MTLRKTVSLFFILCCAISGTYYLQPRWQLSTNFSTKKKDTPIKNKSLISKDSLTNKNNHTEETTSEEMVKPNPPISQETIDRLEKELSHSQTESGGSVKNNPPLTQETIDYLTQKANKGGEKHLLTIKHQVQKQWNTCAPTTVSMMLSSRGIDVSQDQLAVEMKTDTSFGTHNSNAIAVLNHHLFGYDTPNTNQPGYRLETVTSTKPVAKQMAVFKERLIQNISDDYPMYYTIDNSKLYANSHGEHNVIGIGYQLTEDGTDIAYIYYIDPSYYQQDPIHGGLKKITPQALFEAMLPCVEPNYAW